MEIEKNTDVREFTSAGDLVVEVRSEIGERLIQTGSVTLKGQIDPIAISYRRARQLQVLVKRGAQGVVRVSPEFKVNLPDILGIELILKTEAIPGWQGTEIEASETGAVLATETRVTVTKDRVLDTDRDPTQNADGTITVTRTAVPRTAVEILKDTKEVFGLSEEEPTSVGDGIRKSYANGNASSLWGEALRLNKAVILERNTKKGMWYVVDGKLVLRQARVAEGGGLLWLD